MYKYFKRIIDLIITLILLVPFSLISIPISILIKFEDKGPVFYKGERLGKDCKVFKMYKFRTMKMNAPDIRNKDGSTFNAQNDPRITKIGKILRETSLDELPQLINVVKNEMSLIGPRASLGNSLSTYKNDEIEKMKVKPGITGFTQAYFRNNLSMREKRLKDVWYANNYSLKLDLKIVFRTIITVINRENIYNNIDYKNKKD